MNLASLIGRSILTAALPLLITQRALAFDTFDVSWPSGDIPVVLDLDNSATSVPSSFFDGSTSWNQVARASIAEWNAHLVRSQIVPTDATVEQEPGDENGTTEIAFSNTIYGDEFGETTLGVTLIRQDPQNFSAIGEADIVLNKTRPWNSYRGDFRVGTNDLRRVLTHELGHMLGMDHPDQADPPQEVEALMNSTVGDLDQLAQDDIDAAIFLYGTALVTPEITGTTPDLVVDVGDLVTIDMEVGGVAAPITTSSDLVLDWFFPDSLTSNFPENYLFIEDKTRIFIGLAQTYDSGEYTMFAANPDGFDTGTVNLTVNPVPTSPLTQLSNLSTRGFTGAGERALTVGFVIRGTEPLEILLRAAGPTLAEPPYSVPGTLPDPILTLRRSEPGGGSSLVATNDNWNTSDINTASELRDTAATLGAFALNEGSGDAAMLVTLEPGIYTATVSGAEAADQATEGVVIVEAYDVNKTGTGSRLVNLSTRGFVTNNDSTMIAGLVVSGPAARTYLMRVAGDTLGDFGITQPVDDPLMTILQGTTPLRINDDWDHPPVHQEMLRAKMAELGAFALTDRQESVMLLTLAPGAYTVKVEGFDEASEGVGLVEFYEVPE